MKNFRGTAVPLLFILLPLLAALAAIVCFASAKQDIEVISGSISIALFLIWLSLLFIGSGDNKKGGN